MNLITHIKYICRMNIAYFSCQLLLVVSSCCQLLLEVSQGDLTVSGQLLATP